jgi:hypothetical protein
MVLEQVVQRCNDPLLAPAVYSGDEHYKEVAAGMPLWKLAYHIPEVVVVASAAVEVAGRMNPGDLSEVQYYKSHMLASATVYKDQKRHFPDRSS